MILLLEGRQGSGKGTYALMLTEKLDASCFESGRELRRISREETSLGREIKMVLDSGGLVSDADIYFLTKDWLSEVPVGENVIFDGCPRKMSQTTEVENLLLARGEKFDVVILLSISDELAVERLIGRLVCTGPAEHVFNVKTRPPLAEGVCDYDGSPLIKREDETTETIKARLENYHKETEPVIDYFQKKGIVLEIEASRPVEMVFGDIMAKLSERFGELGAPHLIGEGKK